MNKKIVFVSGMTCRSCETLIERVFGKLSGVKSVRAHEKNGTVELEYSGRAPTNNALRKALAGSGYELRSNPTRHVEPKHWREAAIMLLVVIAGYLILHQFDIFKLSSRAEGALGFGAIILIGLTAATSTCLAVVGGLLISVSAKWYETFQPETHWQKFVPLLHFNIGRLVGYFLFGGIVGVIGMALTPSVRATGWLTIVIAFVMILLGLNILQIVPKKYCSVPLPRGLMRRIYKISESKNPLMPAVLGALTFFVPCGFTQSMQLLALGTGNFIQGGLVMLAFAVGTLPALLGISAISSFSEGAFGKYFFKFSGAVALFLGIYNLNGGFVLTGIDIQHSIVQALRGPTASTAENVYIDQNGKQIIKLTVTDRAFTPANITIKPGIQTWVYADAPVGVNGCASILNAPAFNVSTPIKQGENWLGPIENPKEDFVIACSMGMLRTNVHVDRS